MAVLGTLALVAVVGVTYGIFRGTLVWWSPDSLWSTQSPAAVAYQPVTDPRQVDVVFCGRTGDLLSERVLREDGRSVVVGVQMRLPVNTFYSGRAFTIRFQLNSPLGDRVIRDEHGIEVPKTSDFLCPG